jgi:hypothetical protein
MTRQAINARFTRKERLNVNALLGHEGHPAKLLSSDIELIKTARHRLYDALANLSSRAETPLYWYKLEIFDHHKAADITAPLLPIQSMLDRTRKILKGSDLNWITYPCQRILVDKNGVSSILSSQRTIIWSRTPLAETQRRAFTKGSTKIKSTLREFDEPKIDRAVSWLVYLAVKPSTIITKRGSAILRASGADYDDDMRLRILECRSQISFSANFIGAGDGRSIRNGVHDVIRSWHRGRPVPGSVNVLPETVDIWLLWARSWAEAHGCSWVAMRFDRAPTLPKLRRNTKPGKNRRRRPGQRHTPVPLHVSALDRLAMKRVSVTD